MLVRGVPVVAVSTVRADLHCVTKFSILDNEWRGVLASTLLDAGPPAAGRDARDGVGGVRLRRQHAAGRLRRTDVTAGDTSQRGAAVGRSTACRCG